MGRTFEIIANPDMHSVSDDEAKRLFRDFEKIRKARGYLNPRVVVEEARPESSPLHKFFTWDNKAAAEKYREVEAERLLRVVYQQDYDDAGNPIGDPVRALLPIRVTYTEPTPPGVARSMGYLPQSEIRKVPSYQEQIMSMALQQIKTWRKKFGNYKKFYGIAAEIDKVNE